MTSSGFLWRHNGVFTNTHLAVVRPTCFYNTRLVVVTHVFLWGEKWIENKSLYPFLTKEALIWGPRKKKGEGGSFQMGSNWGFLKLKMDDFVIRGWEKIKINTWYIAEKTLVLSP